MTNTESGPCTQSKPSTTQPTPHKFPRITELRINHGPDRAMLYSYSEFCLDGNSGKRYEAIFSIQPNKHVVGSFVNAHVSSIEHHCDSPYKFRLSGELHLSLIGIKGVICRFTGRYDTRSRIGHFQVHLPQ